MFKIIDSFLNKTTMYRLVLYYLLVLFVAAVVFSFLKILPYDPLALVFSAAFITLISWAANNVFAKVFGAPANTESIYITALILALIVTPLKSLTDFGGLPFLGWAAIWAMASKFIFAIKKKHIFNPAAFAVALTALTINQSASWWVGTLPMLPFVLLGGILIARKIIRFDLVISFLMAASASTFYFGIARGTNFLTIASQSFLNSALFFFAFVMITEPLTTPPDRGRRIAYGALVGLLFAPAVHIGAIFSTPELALLCGNLFSYLISPKKKLILKLKEILDAANDTYDFIFLPDQKFKFKPGQYLEWTLGHEKPDSRGNRRYFTIASSPTEPEIRMGAKFYPNPSSFKKSLVSLSPGDEIVASQLAGDFVLPKDKTKKLVFMAGGIGITPFRSMVKFLLDKNEKRDIVLVYSNKTEGDIAYRDIFDQAERAGVKVIYVLTDVPNIPPNWRGERGFVDGAIIQRLIPDFWNRTFYLSGPHSMVTAFDKTLKGMGISGSRIKEDYFPGFV